jgi:OmpA-OmpF porin, OOP family
MKKLTLAASIMAILSTQAFAEAGKQGDEWLAGFGEYYSTDQEIAGFPTYVSDAVGFGGEFGFRFKPQWAARLELSKLDVNAAPLGNDSTAYRVGFDALYFLKNDLMYAFGGYKHVDITDSGNMLNIGLGKHWALNDKWRLITEVASYYNLDNGTVDMGVKLGFGYSFGSTTSEPVAAMPKDSDRDGVYDVQDQCPNTPAGTVVDATGCSVDSDNDGVLNDMDQCPNTPAGTPVGAKGCPLSEDADEDGVLDNVDQCANTPITDKVDAVGCSMFMEEEVVQNLVVPFANNSSIIKDPNSAEIQEFAEFMKRFPGTDTVIEGHASAPGADSYNLMLSQKRADAVRKLLIDKYGIAAERITAVGYGETQLLDTANTPEAHAKNRRLTAKVTASKRVKVLKQ